MNAYFLTGGNSNSVVGTEVTMGTGSGDLAAVLSALIAGGKQTYIKGNIVLLNHNRIGIL